MNEIMSRQVSASRQTGFNHEVGRPVVVVVGMHRSGTSLCSIVLNMLGVDMADEAGADHTNEVGHFERWDLVRIHDEILSIFDRAYFGETHDYPLPPAWWSDLRVRPLAEKLKQAIVPALERSPLIGFKDPRTAKLLPVWNRIFVELGLSPRYVICVRDPAHVAVSLNRRDQLDVETGELRALDYMIDAIRYTQGKLRCFLKFEDWFTDPSLNLTKLLDICKSHSIERNDLELALNALVHSDLNRSGQSAPSIRQPLVRSFYSMLLNYVDGGDEERLATSSQLQTFSAQYVAFRQLLSPFEVKHRAALKAKEVAEQQVGHLVTSLQANEASQEAVAADLARKLADAHSGLTERDAELGAIKANQAIVTADLSSMLAGVRKSLAERDAELGALTTLSQQEKASHAEVVAELSARLSQMGEMLAAGRLTLAHTQAESEHLQAELANAQKDLAERDTQLHEMSVFLRQVWAMRAGAAAEQGTNRKTGLPDAGAANRDTQLGELLTALRASRAAVKSMALASE